MGVEAGWDRMGRQLYRSQLKRWTPMCARCSSELGRVCNLPPRSSVSCHIREESRSSHSYTTHAPVTVSMAHMTLPTRTVLSCHISARPGLSSSL